MTYLKQYIHHPAWMDGFRAFAQDLGRERNPYLSKGSVDYQAWDQGWVSAQKERAHVEEIKPDLASAPQPEVTQ